MGFTYKKEMPSADHLKELLPVPEGSADLRIKKIKEIEDILSGKDNRILLIIGPCSADNEDAVCEYISRLATLRKRLRTRLCSFPEFTQTSPTTARATRE